MRALKFVIKYKDQLCDYKVKVFTSNAENV